MSEIESKVKEIIADKLGVDEADVKPEASFTNDLGADSLDTVELIMEFHTPLITANDCEGAGEMFHVTAFDLKNVPVTSEGQPDYSRDFFGKEKIGRAHT